jgi:hypothetical protein
MSKKIAPRLQFNILENEIEEDEGMPVLEDIDNVDEELIEDDNLSLPQPVEKEEIKQENIFDVPEEKNQLVQELIQKKLPKPKKEPVKKEPKLTKAGKPRKAMSEEQKRRLAIGRQKALEVRRMKKKERDEQKLLDEEENKLLKKKRQKDLERLKQEVNDEEPVPVKSNTSNGATFTQKDLENAQLNAIISYEKIRAERKAKKKEEELIKKQQEDIKNKLLNPAGARSHYNPSNRYYHCY